MLLNLDLYILKSKKIFKMWCHDGKVSLASFLSGIITTVFISILVLSIFSLELNTFKNVVFVLIGPIGTYALFCVITYFVTSKNDFAVRFYCIFNFSWTIYDFLFFSLQNLDSKKSYCPWCGFWIINNLNILFTDCMETIGCILFIYVNISLQRICNNLMGKSTNTHHRHIHVESLCRIFSSSNKFMARILNWGVSMAKVKRKCDNSFDWSGNLCGRWNFTKTGNHNSEQKFQSHCPVS